MRECHSLFVPYTQPVFCSRFDIFTHIYAAMQAYDSYLSSRQSIRCLVTSTVKFTISDVVFDSSATLA